MLSAIGGTMGKFLAPHQDPCSLEKDGAYTFTQGNLGCEAGLQGWQHSYRFKSVGLTPGEAGEGQGMASIQASWRSWVENVGGRGMPEWRAGLEAGSLTATAGLE